METTPLIFPCHVSAEQKKVISNILSKLSAATNYYSVMCLTNPRLSTNAILSIIEDLSQAINYSNLFQWRIISYNIRISILKLELILSYTMFDHSGQSTVIDSILVDSITDLHNIIDQTYELYLDL